jgi:hypothetical protein
MNGDDPFAKDISTRLFKLETQLLQSLELQRSFIVMAFELLQESKSFTNQAAFDEWLDMLTQLQR